MLLKATRRMDTGSMENGMSGVSARSAAWRAVALAMLAVVHTPAGAAPAGGDAAAGKTVSVKCMVCHTFEAGKNKIGPSLAGVVGRKSGSIADFAYSPAMKGSNLTWDAATLDRYLANPRTVVPGTKMIFPGLPSAADRANLIAYLAQLPGSAPAGK